MTKGTNASVINRWDLQEAIEALEAHRAILEPVAVDTAIAILRERLSLLRDQPATDAPIQVVVLVADLSGYTAMSEFLDAEQVRDTINAVWQQLDYVIRAWYGRIDKHVGDGMIALFGLSDGAEDMYERAVRAGLDIQLELQLFNAQAARLKQIAWPGDQTLQMRVGIHSGPIYWGKVGSSEQYTAIGDTVTVAERVEQRAPVGATVISQQVQRRVSDLFVLQAHALPAAADQGERLPMYVVQGESGDSMAELARQEPAPTRLVGRETPLAMIQQAVQETISGGMGQLVIVQGAQGVGKTRLAMELHRLLRTGPDLTTWYGRVAPELAHVPYALFRDVITRRCHIRPWQQDRSALTRLTVGLGSVLPDAPPGEVAQLTRTLGRMLAFAAFAHDSPVPGYGFEALARLFRDAAARGPVLLLLDDLHLADDRSLALLSYLAEACQDVPLAIVALANPVLAERPSWLQTSLPPLTVTLDPLSPIDARHFVNELLPNLSPLPQLLADHLVASSAGNPHFLIELVDQLIAGGIIDTSTQPWQAHVGRLRDMTVPTTLRGFYWWQYGRLNPPEQACLRRAAVCGPVFWAEAIRVETQDDAQVLPRLVEKGVIRPHRRPYLPEQAEYRFRHPLLRQVAYDTISAKERRTYHAFMAQWFDADAGRAFPLATAMANYHTDMAQRRGEE